MNPMILVVDDQLDILVNIKLTLELNNYRVITATNGKEALQLLSDLEAPPDLIISDIMMPKMDGYNFFKMVSANPQWAFIPFIFLSALATPEDVRFGKMLGVDDYLTKPFQEEDLLAIIAGKLARTKKTKSLQKRLETNLMASLKIDVRPSISEKEKKKVFLLVVVWDEVRGPVVKVVVPEEKNPPFSLHKLGVQLFQAAVSIYGQTGFYEAQGILLNIENIKQAGYLYFDLFADETVRGGCRQFMVAIIAPKISYFESLKIKECLQDLANRIKAAKEWDKKQYWETISGILTTPIL
ncbi:MAG: PleD family two-component system response regulator [Candidatus Heimdallarchaeota archaeon]